MNISDVLASLKETTSGIVVLGAVGSLVAALIASVARLAAKYAAKRVKNTRNAHAWNFGWMSAYCSADVKHQPIFITFLVAHVIRTLLFCVCAVLGALIAAASFAVSTNAVGYAFAVVMLACGIFAFWTAAEGYRITKDGYIWWIEALKKEKSGTAREQKQGAHVGSSFEQPTLEPPTADASPSRPRRRRR